jgi:hypothetical protein
VRVLPGPPSRFALRHSDTLSDTTLGWEILRGRVECVGHGPVSGGMQVRWCMEVVVSIAWRVLTVAWANLGRIWRQEGVLTEIQGIGRCI